MNSTAIPPHSETGAVDLSKVPQPILADHPEWVDLYHFAWSLAAKHIRRSRGRLHMDVGWGTEHNYQWVWDSCFMALFCRYGNGEFPGMASLDNFYDLQREDGYISMTYDMDSGEEPWPDRINPPLFAWVEWEYYRQTGDSSRFARVVVPIEKLMSWIDANRRNRPHRRMRATDSPPEGLGESTDTYRLYFFEDGGSSGMDDSPRAPRIPEAGQVFDWVDLSSQMALSSRMLGRMHAVLGNVEKSKYWEARACALGEIINAELWAERTRFYHDRYLPKNFLGHKTVAGFWPILAGICSRDRLNALVEHLLDEREFNRPTLIPSLSADDVNYSPQGRYWCGGVWAPTNYMITRGLMLAGRGDIAHDIALRYVGALARTYEAVSPHTLWEAYSPEEDKPAMAPYLDELVRQDFVGWTGLGPIAMLIENVIGVDVCAPERKIVWTIRRTERHGVRNLGIGDGVVDLICAPREGIESPANIEICSTVPWTAVLRRGSVEKIISLAPGKRETVLV